MPQQSVVYSAHKFRVEHHERRAADGARYRYDVIVHPGAAVILPLLDAERVVLIHNFRPTLDRELLELPAGTLDPGEDPLACARRELAEETGYRAGRIEELVAFYSTPGFCTEKMHAFVARELSAGPTQLEDSERIRPVVLSYAEALAGIRGGRIVDGKTIATLLYYHCFVRGESRG